MTFKKGEKLGRPIGAKSKKEPFNLKNVLASRFSGVDFKLNERHRQIQTASKCPGKTCLLRHLEGGQNSYYQAILAQCFECMGLYADGKNDCENPLCSLYPFMPYRIKSELGSTGNSVVIGTGGAFAQSVADGGGNV